MSEFTLKQDDLVYYPLRSNKIFKLANSRYSDTGYPLEIHLKEFSQTITTDGKTNSFQNVPVVFPATQEWYELLSKSYPNVNFEKPPIKKSSKEVIQALLDDGNVGVVCWVSDSTVEPTSDSYSAIITGIDNAYTEHNTISWIYATPIMPIKSLNQIITDYVDGELILENANG